MGVGARFAADEYARAARALMPRAAAWANDPQSVQGRTLAALALSLWRSDAASMQLLVDAFPATTTALLVEWEASLGLVAADGATAEQRRARVVARLVGAGGQSRARFIAFAATLGFTIAIDNFAPLRAGRFRAGDPARSRLWIDAWRVRVLANPGGLPVATLKAELDAIRPAETTILLA